MRHICPALFPFIRTEEGHTQQRLLPDMFVGQPQLCINLQAAVLTRLYFLLCEACRLIHRSAIARQSCKRRKLGRPVKHAHLRMNR